jgi:hypothetical protein
MDAKRERSKRTKERQWLVNELSMSMNENENENE